ncbi:hypothetical protein HanIR_Chr09g0426461 [Helianthus annuus]|nr:hypothetical protein HanIR_Chr09g0426461 [Helianthus annuus]
MRRRRSYSKNMLSTSSSSKTETRASRSCPGSLYFNRISEFDSHRTVNLDNKLLKLMVRSTVRILVSPPT